MPIKQPRKLKCSCGWHGDDNDLLRQYDKALGAEWLLCPKCKSDNIRFIDTDNTETQSTASGHSSISI